MTEGNPGAGDDGEMIHEAGELINMLPFDFSTYLSRYIGRTRIFRLIFMAEQFRNFGDESMELKALEFAHDELKETSNTSLYRKVIGKIDGRSGVEYVMDDAWVGQQDRQASLAEADFIRRERNGPGIPRFTDNWGFYQKEMDQEKESFMMIYRDFGAFLAGRNSMSKALEKFNRMFDYCITAKQIRIACLLGIINCIDMGQLTEVPGYVEKMKQLPAQGTERSYTGLQTAVLGLVHLKAKEYKLAALKFVDATYDGIEIGRSTILAAEDIGTYGAFCALASFDRAALKEKVIDNANFQKFLARIPVVKEHVLDLYSSRYSSCLQYLAILKKELLLDIHLHRHVETLYNAILNKALIQYTRPYVSVDLTKMAKVFQLDINELEKKLGALIIDDKLKARIDRCGRALWIRQPDERKVTFRRVLQAGEEFEQTVSSMLLRMSLLSSEDPANYEYQQHQ